MFSFKIREGKKMIFFLQTALAMLNTQSTSVLYVHMVINTNYSGTALRHRYLPPDVQVQKHPPPCPQVAPVFWCSHTE